MSEESSDRKAPGFWYYPSDFERDVQMLSLAAQGLWIRMLGWMSENEMHRGFLELPNGQPMTEKHIAARVGKPIVQIRAALKEMEELGTFSRVGNSTSGGIYCRRMARDTHISTVRREAAKSRLAKARREENGTFAGDFAPANAPAKPEQTPTVTASASVSVSDSVKPPPPLPSNEWPLTAAAVAEVDPAANGIFTSRLVQATIQQAISDGKVPMDLVTDKAIAAAVRESIVTHSGKQRHGAGLLLSRVPQIIITWGHNT